MSFKRLSTLIYILLFSFLLLNVSNASESHFDGFQQTPSDCSTPKASHTRFHADDFSDEEDDEKIDETSTEIARQVLPTISVEPHSKASEEDGFISIEKQKRITPTIHIVGGMFDTLSLPNSSMPYTEIMLLNCTCFGPLDPSQFQNNPELRILSLTGSQLNLRHFEEKIGENCANLSHIDLQDFIDVSAEGQPIITPERFAQLAHPDILQRILSGQCNLFVSHPERDNKCYGIDEMKEKFLSSILQVRSLKKAEETVSTYQILIGMLTSGINQIDPTQLAKAGGRVLLNTCTGGIIKGS